MRFYKSKMNSSICKEKFTEQPVKIITADCRKKNKTVEIVIVLRMQNQCSLVAQTKCTKGNKNRMR